MDNSIESNAGRPSIDPAYRLAARAWFNAVSITSGGLSASELEKLFTPKQSENSPPPKGSSGIWGKYRDGKICPKINRDYKDRPSIVERVENEFPGTSHWLTHPFWRVLGYEPLSMSALKEIYLELPGPIMDLLVAEKPPYNRMFWRRPGDFDRTYEGLLLIGNIDSFAAILALIKECEVSQNQEMHQRGLYYFGYCAKKLRTDPIISPLVDGINKIIEDRYARISYVSSDGAYFKLARNTIRSTLRS